MRILEAQSFTGTLEAAKSFTGTLEAVTGTFGGSTKLHKHIGGSTNLHRHIGGFIGTLEGKASWVHWRHKTSQVQKSSRGTLLEAKALEAFIGTLEAKGFMGYIGGTSFTGTLETASQAHWRQLHRHIGDSFIGTLETAS